MAGTWSRNSRLPNGDPQKEASLPTPQWKAMLGDLRTPLQKSQNSVLSLNPSHCCHMFSEDMLSTARIFPERKGRRYYREPILLENSVDKSTHLARRVSKGAEGGCDATQMETGSERKEMPSSNNTEWRLDVSCLSRLMKHKCLISSPTVLLFVILPLSEFVSHLLLLLLIAITSILNLILRSLPLSEPLYSCFIYILLLLSQAS